MHRNRAAARPRRTRIPPPCLALLALLFCDTLAGQSGAPPTAARRQDNFYGIGPALGYAFSGELAGWTAGFDAAWNIDGLSLSLGGRYVRTEPAGTRYGANDGLLGVHLEAVGAIGGIFPIGAGGGYHFLLGNRHGPGAHLFFCVPFVLETTGYFLLFYRPGLVWLGGNRETIHEVGLYFKFSNLTARNR